MENVPKWLWWTVSTAGFILLILLFGGGWLREIVSSGFSQSRTQDPRFVEVINNLRWEMWIKDAWVMILFTMGLIITFYLYLKEHIAKVIFIGIIGALAIIDVGFVDYKIVQPDQNSGRNSQLINKKAIARYFQHDNITKFLTEDESTFRVYPIGPLFGESRLQAFGIESVGGYHPAKLGIYNRFLSNTNNISTLPLMRMMNIHYILSPQVINHPGLEHVFTENMQTGSGKIQIWVYRISDSLPRTWFVDEVEVVNESNLWQNLLSETFDATRTAYINEPITRNNVSVGEIISAEYAPNYIKIETKNSEVGFLVISEVHYPLRWKAKVDGESVKTFETNGVIRGIEVPSGEHFIEFVYDKSVFHKGILISNLSFIVVLGFIAVGLVKIKRIK